VVAFSCLLDIPIEILGVAASGSLEDMTGNTIRRRQFYLRMKFGQPCIHGRTVPHRCAQNNVGVLPVNEVDEGHRDHLVVSAGG